LIEDRRFTQPPTIEKTFLRTGPAAKDFEAVDVLPMLTTRAVDCIRMKREKPFFLYVALTSPHTPIVPSSQWRNKSELGAYGDFVMQTDGAVGQILQSIDDAKITANTLVIFTSDNGCSPAAGVTKLEAAGHFASAEYRGYKADIWEGGHRVPFIVRWPDVVKAGTRNDALICQTDLLATCAQLLDVTLPPDAAVDSISMLPHLSGKSSGVVRKQVVNHSIYGRFAIRDEKWKLEFCPGSGGWSAPRDAEANKRGLPPVQLYDLATDPGEQRNVAAEHADIVQKMTRLLETTVVEGRSTPGPKQRNDVAVTVKNLP
jgi:arylsulfatase A-like enzyme